MNRREHERAKRWMHAHKVLNLCDRCWPGVGAALRHECLNCSAAHCPSPRELAEITATMAADVIARAARR